MTASFPATSPVEAAAPSDCTPHGHPVTASVWLLNRHDHVLVVHPANKPDAPWQLPGGLVEPRESPTEAAIRETHEELGIEVVLGPENLLTVEWLQATRPGHRDRLAFVFSARQLTDAEARPIRLQASELDDWRWEPPGSALRLLHPSMAARMVDAVECAGAALYRETRNSAERTLTA